MKDDAEKDLAAAKPALDAALAALNSITPKDITALKALKNPPDIVKRIFDCVLLLRCAHPFWNPSVAYAEAETIQCLCTWLSWLARSTEFNSAPSQGVLIISIPVEALLALTHLLVQDSVKREGSSAGTSTPGKCPSYAI